VVSRTGSGRANGLGLGLVGGRPKGKRARCSATVFILGRWDR